MSGVIAISPRFYFSDALGVPLSSGTLTTYIAGSTTPEPTYQDLALTIANTNPIILDASGSCLLWLDSSKVYKFLLKDSSGVTVPGWPVDNISGAASIASLSGLFVSVSDLSNSVDLTKGISLVGGAQRMVATVGAIRALPKTGTPNAFAAGYYAAGDSGGGSFYYDSADTTSADNGGTIIVAADGGRWKRASSNKLSVKQFGAKGDGTTDDTAFILNAKLALTAGGELYFSPGTYIVSTDTCLNVALPGITISGDGSVSVIKAKANAALVTLVANGAAGFTIRDIVIDGNRANAGMSTASYMLYMGASNTKAENVEVRFAVAYAVFMGSSVATPTGLVVNNCWIHDNGGTTTTVGFGVGIYGGGAFLPDDVRVQNCRIENNFNTVPGFPGDSTATNIRGTNIIVDGCFVKDNHNVGGGQIVLSSNTTDGSSPGRHVVSNNVVAHTTVFAGENTCGIELEARKFVISGNVVQSLNSDGIRVETSGGDGIVSDNVCECTAAGIDLISTGGVGIQKTLVTDNLILSAGTGIQVQANPGNVMLIDNYIDASIPNKIVGEGNCALIRGNVGYAPPIQTGLVAGVSPYSFPLLNYDATYSAQVPAGTFSASLQGVNVSYAQYVPVFVKAGRTFTIAWATTAPTYALIPQQ